MKTKLATIYSVERGWRDGESMCAHNIGKSLSIEQALKLQQKAGGYLVRETDGAVSPNCGKTWIPEV